jgi:hypothetical protein
MTISKISKKECDLSNDKECQIYWNELAQDLLLNGRIIDVRYMNPAETEKSGWYHSPVCLLIRKGKKEFWVYPMQDDEGNNGGALATTSKDEPCLPVMRYKEVF